MKIRTVCCGSGGLPADPPRRARHSPARGGGPVSAVTPAAVVIAILLCGCNQQPLHRDNRVLMGTFVDVVSTDARASQIAFAEIGRVEKLFSKFDAQSVVSRLNRERKLKVTAEVFYLLKKSKEFSRNSQGAFDIGVGELMDIWGFSDKRFRRPSDDEIKSALSCIEQDKIILDETSQTVELTCSGLKLDLGAVAKGYAVDCAIKKLRQAGINSALVNAGGEIYCLGNIRGRPWKVAIKNPAGKGVSGTLSLQDRAVATSGGYEQYFVIEGRHYAHIMDPRTGQPAEQGVISVSISAPDCLTADALATAAYVLGRDNAEELIKKYPGSRIESLITER